MGNLQDGLLLDSEAPPPDSFCHCFTHPLSVVISLCLPWLLLKSGEDDGCASLREDDASPHAARDLHPRRAPLELG